MRKLIIVAIIALGASGAFAQSKTPKTPRDYFMQLPDKYFDLDCCMSEKNPKAVYLKRYLNVEDNANGYISGHADAAQEGFALTLFKRPNGTYLIGFYTFGEGGPEDTPWTYFFDYSNGKWRDVSRTMIAGYNKAKFVYELPRTGTTVHVYQKDENGRDWYKGKKLYDLHWKNGKFVKGA